MFSQTVRGMYCCAAAAAKVVRGKFEAERFYPLRGLLRSLLSKPVLLHDEHAHACMDCGLTWNEVDPRICARTCAAMAWRRTAPA